MKKLVLAMLMLTVQASAASEDINSYSLKIMESNQKEMQADIKELTRLYYRLERSSIPREDVTELKETMKDLNKKLDGIDLQEMRKQVNDIEKDHGRIAGDVTWIKLVGGFFATIVAMLAADALRSYAARRRNGNGNGQTPFYIKSEDVPWWREMSKRKDEEGK